MSDYVLFLILGIGAGAVYAMLGLGLVLKYRSAGVVDFAHGAVAMFAAYVFVELRSTGTLQFPWVWIPHEFQISSSGIPSGLAALISLVYAAVFGLVTYVLVYRPLRTAAPLTRVCASVGIMLALQAVAVLNFGSQAKATPPLLPTSSWEIGGILVPHNRLYLGAVAVFLAVVLALVYRYTTFGLATRAGAENETGASLIGLSPTRIAAQNWVVATLLAAGAGILIAPISQLDPVSYTLFIVPALGVALVGRFSSFGITAAAGLLLGMAQSEITKLTTVWTWLPSQGVAEGLPFLVIMVAMTITGTRLIGRGQLIERGNPSIGRPRRPYTTAAALFVAGVVLLVVLQGSLRSAFISSVIMICICLSLVVLTGFVGQVSLAQMTFAGIGAFALSHLAEGAGVPFPFSLLLAALASVPLGLLIGLPALRVRGVNLAVVTLAAAATIDVLVFNNTSFSGGLGGREVPSPTLFGLDLGIAKGEDYPRVVFGVLVLVIVTLVGLLVARLRNGPAGRMLIAVRSNERAAASVGIDVARTKLFAFGLSSFIAGLGGGLLAYQQGTVSPGSFAVFTSLGLLAIAYVAGVGQIAGAVVAGIMFAPTGVFVTALDKLLGVGKYQTLVAGIALAMTAIGNPDGLVSTRPGTKGPAVLLVRLRDRLAGWYGSREVVAAEHQPGNRVES